MAAFDNVVEQDHDRMARLEFENQQFRDQSNNRNQQFNDMAQQNQELANEANLWRDRANRQGPFPPPPPYYPPPPPPPPRLDLLLPQPQTFSGDPSELRSFKLRLTQYVGANFERYNNTQDQILYAGSLLKGLAGKWYEALVDPVTYVISPSYSFESFLQALDDFFGGGVNVQTLERSLINLRQTGTVSELAIAFQNITNTFQPKWPDHPLIFLFSQKLKEVIRFELTGRGSPPIVFQAYVTAAIAVELNQAAAHSSRGGSHHSPAPRPAFQPYAKATPPFPPPRQPQLPPSPSPMDIDATRGVRGPLTQEERRRRFDAGLCGYCGKLGHVINSCPNRYQARGTFQLPPGFQDVHQSQFPGPWQQFPSQDPFPQS